MPQRKLRLAFAGTPEFSVPCLQALIDGPHELVAVYTQPDRPSGRGQRLQASPVKAMALASGIPIFQPEMLKDEQAQTAFSELQLDLFIVIAYGLILPAVILQAPRLGCWNLHASLLPRWRGAAPIQRAIIAGDAETGVCLMKMEKGLDTGPVLLRESTPISEQDTAQTLHDRLAHMSAEALQQGLLQLGKNEIAYVPQESEGICYAHKIEKPEAHLDPTESAIVLARKIRAFNPWPVASIQIEGELLKVHEAIALTEPAPHPPGNLVRACAAGLDVATGQGVLRLLTVQKPGGKPISAGDYVNANPQLKPSG